MNSFIGFTNTVLIHCLFWLKPVYSAKYPPHKWDGNDFLYMVPQAFGRFKSPFERERVDGAAQGGVISYIKDTPFHPSQEESRTIPAFTNNFPNTCSIWYILQRLMNVIALAAIATPESGGKLLVQQFARTLIRGILCLIAQCQVLHRVYRFAIFTHLVMQVRSG